MIILKRKEGLKSLHDIKDTEGRFWQNVSMVANISYIKKYDERNEEDKLVTFDIYWNNEFEAFVMYSPKDLVRIYYESIENIFRDWDLISVED